MKNYLIFTLLSMSLVAGAQDSIEVTFSKTSTLIFEYPVVNVDLGSKDILAQMVEGVENSVQVKAARKDFSGTNLTIFTRDGSIHQLTVKYSDHPEKLVYHISTGGGVTSTVSFSDGINLRELNYLCGKILSLKNHERVVRRSKKKIRIAVEGVYIHEDLILYRVVLSNASHIPFDIESIRFSVRDNQRVKRSATQQEEIFPVHKQRQIDSIDGQSQSSMVFAFKTFMLPNTKCFEIDLAEKSGGRNITLSLRGSDILKAKPILK